MNDKVQVNGADLKQQQQQQRPFRPIHPMIGQRLNDADKEIKASEFVSLAKVASSNYRSVSSSTSPFSSTSSLSASPPLLACDSAESASKESTGPIAKTESAEADRVSPNIEPKVLDASKDQARFQRTKYPQKSLNHGTDQELVKQNLRNALGVSQNEVLPLNKPIIPLEKVVKYETKPGKARPAFHPPNTAPNSNQHLHPGKLTFLLFGL